MRKISSGLFITLDGVVEAPGSGDVSLESHRGWSERYMSQEVGATIFGQMSQNDGMLLGRKTYQEFAAFWPNVPDSDPFGQAMNSMPKYVVSTTLDKVEWNNSTLLKGDLTEAITRLKQSGTQGISVVGSPTLVASLIAHDLLDELQLLLCPVVLGVGKRLFKDGSSGSSMKLNQATSFDTGMVMLSYQPEKK
jgi:dihydrofolate reductase